MTQKIQLSNHFTYRKLLRFTIPSIIMMVFSSIYSIIDGIFVSNFVGKTPFAAVNLVMPFLMILGVVGFMLGTGGSALIAKIIGEGNRRKANSIFSMLVVFGLIIGAVLTLVCNLTIRNVVFFLGAKDEMVDMCILYGRIISFALPLCTLQYMFQSMLITAERPTFALIVTIIAGVLNIILDYLLIVVFHLGLSGAAMATAISQVVGGLIPLIYFLLPNKSLLKITKAKFNIRALIKVLYNGASEFFANISSSILAICYNYQLMKFFGQNGVAAFGTIMYVQFIFAAIFIGYSMGVAPIVSYNYGSQNHKELKNVFSKNIKVILSMGVLLTICLELLAYPLTKIFVGYDTELFDLTRKAFMIYGLAYILIGFNGYASSFFTALNNGGVSAFIATSKALVFETSSVFVLPFLFGKDSIWFAVSVAEFLAMIMIIFILIKYKSRYHYW